jgi:DeoR/GlpR family transcriptional regulator of sugar metabolism
MVAEQGFVRIDELADHFSVTTMTIHRDLDDLNERGVLSKVRSGAKATPLEVIERNVTFRQHHLLDHKRAIAAAAAAWIRERDDLSVVALDDSTTVLALADLLSTDESLTLVTNFRPAIERIAEADAAKLIGIGGAFDPQFQSFHGASAIESVRSIQVDVACISATSVWRGALYNPAEAPLLVKRAMLRQAEHSLLLIDHSKFSRRALHRQAGLEEFDAVIVDSDIDEDTLGALRSSAEHVIVAPVVQR